MWILCHTCSYHKNNMIFVFLKTIELCHTVHLLASNFLEGNKKPIKLSLISPKSNNVQICWISRTNSKFSVKKVCCVFTQFLMLDITNFYTIVLFLNQDWHFDDFGQCCQIHIVFKNPKIIILF